MISRRSHQAAKTPAYAGAPTERLKYAPSIPHWRPRMNARPQITRAEPRIRMPAWRSVSPKKRSTRPPRTPAITRAPKFAISPNAAIHCRGCASTVGHTLPLLCCYSSMVEMAGALDLRVDRDGDVPLGAQLARRIRAAVECKQLGPGDRLPSVRELADAAGVNV